MKTKRLTVTNVSDSYTHNWLGILPFINIQHKYWYLWEINFGWLWGDWTIEVCRRDWKHRGDFDDSRDNDEKG